MTFIYERDPYSLEMYQMSENELNQGFRNLSSDIHTCIHNTDRQRDALEIIYHAASLVVNTISNK